MTKRPTTSEQQAADTAPAFIADILRGHPAGLNAFLAAHGHELAEYVRALTGDDARFEQVYEDVIVDILRQLRLATERRNGRLRLFFFESAARTVRRRHSWIFQYGAGSARPARAPMRELARIAEPGRDDLRRALAGLAAGERELLALRFRFRFNYDEISDILKEARVAFEDRLMAARENFRSRLMSEVSGRVAAVS
jgi:DNA-directed RNA polymerase specialized sigma24 family protein